MHFLLPLLSLFFNIDLGYWQVFDDLKSLFFASWISKENFLLLLYKKKAEQRIFSNKKYINFMRLQSIIEILLKFVSKTASPQQPKVESIF